MPRTADRFSRLSALNPAQTIGAQIREPILLHEQVTARQADARAAELLDSVGRFLRPPQQTG